jgi:hypothetical protein
MEKSEVKCSMTFVKEIDLSSTQGLKDLREDCASEQHQEIETDISWIIYWCNVDSETV